MVIKKLLNRAPVAQELAPNSNRGDCIKLGVCTTNESIQEQADRRKSLSVILLIGANIWNLQGANIQNLHDTKEIK